MLVPETHRSLSSQFQQLETTPLGPRLLRGRRYEEVRHLLVPEKCKELEHIDAELCSRTGRRTGDKNYTKIKNMLTHLLTHLFARSLTFTKGEVKFQPCWADGTSTKPLVILPLKLFPAEVDEDLAHSFAWSGQESGWITTEIFEQFIEKVFLPDLQRRRRAEEQPDAPALLYVDGHSSRANPKVLRLLRDANVTVITFVAHASHLLQPLDKWLFLQFKSHLQDLSSKIRNLSRPEQRLAMLQAVESSMHNSMKPTNILKSFRRAGLWPIDPEQVFHPATDSSPEERRRRSRKSFNINGIVLTSEEIVAGLEEEKQAIKSAKKRAEKKKKPQSHDQDHTATQVDEEMQPNEQ